VGVVVFMEYSPLIVVVVVLEGYLAEVAMVASVKYFAVLVVLAEYS
jgi:hypothetical protein